MSLLPLRPLSRRVSQIAGRRFFCLGLIAGSLFGGAPSGLAADTQNCQLVRIAKLDMATDEGGRVNVPMTINGRTVSLLVDTGGAVSTLTQSTAKSFGFTPEPKYWSYASPYYIAYGGERLYQHVTVTDAYLGGIRAPELQLYVMSDERVAPGVDGLLSYDILRGFDVDFDFANATLSLFSQNHCEDRVVYWTQAGYARIPFEMVEGHHIAISLEIDGKNVSAMVDTGSRDTLGRLEALQNKFDIGDSDPALKSAAKPGDGDQLFRYPFKAMTFQGVTVNNPDIGLRSDRVSALPPYAPDIILGMNVLSRLHIYVAYGEHALYVTPATAH